MTKSTPKKTTSKKPATKAAKSKSVKKPVQNKVVISAKKTSAPKVVPATKKPSSPKATVPTSKKSVTKKTVLKKSASKKAAPIAARRESIKKPVRNKITTSAKKTTAPKVVPVTKAPSTTKVTASKKPVSRKANKDELGKTLANLEARMKRADTLTRKSVKALESAVMTLDARTRKDNSTGKAALTRKVNQLSAKLTEMVEKTQAEVNSELKTVLNNPSVENLQAALFRADQQLNRAEQAQAAAISKVNRHLASIATAVDARIEEEAKSRKTAIAALQAETKNNQTALTTRIDTIEADTARALSGTGDKIAELSEELTRRGEASELSIREKVSEVALQTQTEFESYRAGLERRIEDIAQNHPDNNTQRLEHSIASLTARLEGLEYAVANAPAAPAGESLEQATPPQLSLVSSEALPPAAAPQAVTHTPQLPDAFSPLAQIAETPAAVTMPNPYLTEQASPEPEPVIEPEATGPVEFDPRNYMANRQEAVQAPPPPTLEPAIATTPLPETVTPEPLTPEPLRDFTQPEVMPIAVPSTEFPPPPGMDQPLPYADPAYADPAYADPAYAEAIPTLDKVRIGGEAAPQFNLPKLTGRNLRVAALATGVAVIGLVAAKGVFGNADTSTPSQQTAQNTQDPNQNANNVTPVSIPQPNTTAAPIGNYADNKAATLAQSSDAAKTLNSAASAGDPVAQFQLGLSYLSQGRTNEAVTLIRKSANQNQPAAQYRLAKLYESGEGVTQDAEMARQLTERAARNGNRIAMHDLALYYAEGRGGVEADLPTAANWFEKAAERGVVDSQFNLAVLFESGQGLPKNITNAFVWYSIAAGQGDQFAKTRIEVLKDTLDQTDLITATSRAEKFKPVKIDDAANGIFRNVAWAKSNGAASEKVSQVRQAQTMLTELGYEIGGADGSIGPKTRAAIMSFERANSLPETGRVNASLVDRLELATGA